MKTGNLSDGGFATWDIVGREQIDDGAFTLLKVVFAKGISRADALRLLCKVVAFVEGCDGDICDALDAHRPAWESAPRRGYSSTMLVKERDF